MLDPELIARFRGRVLALTGAGVSVASGIRPFRGDEGLYEGLNPYELASPEAFAQHPVTVWNWYLMRIHQGKSAQPNPAHHALAELERLAEHFTLVTSNVDELHEQAGSKRVFHLHGRIFERRCSRCSFVERVDPFALPERIEEPFTCACGGYLRPNVVWFGEYPWADAIEAVRTELPAADIVIEVGSSGVVSYGFAEAAVRLGIPVVIVNPDPFTSTGMTVIAGKAEIVLPQIVEEVGRC